MPSRKRGKGKDADMNRFRSLVFLLSTTAAPVALKAEAPVRLPEPTDPGPASVVAPDIRLAANGMLLQPPSFCDPGTLPPIGEESLPLGDAAILSLAELEQLALANNPAIGQASAHVNALRGRLIQVGLPPNPTAGYMAGEIGNEGRAGQQGGYIGQDFITGGKLRLNRAVVSQEVQRAEQWLAAVTLRAQTDVRRGYYAALIAQRRADLAAELVRLSGKAVQASRDLKAAEEIPTAGLLQTEVEQQNAQILSQTANNEQAAAWRNLSAVVGTDLPMQRLDGDASKLPPKMEWDEQLARVTASSPEAAAAFAQIARAQNVLRRARVERIPDISTQVSVQFDNATEDTITGVQVGLPLPIWNRNQGGIRQAQAEVSEAQRNLNRVELDLKRRLAATFQQYSTARAQAEIYSTQILPKSKETFDLVQRGYGLGELGYLDLLSAQRTYSQTNLAYLEALAALWSSWAEIEGLLLSDSLGTPFEMANQGDSF
jgi:cobalt-zinc-cadmium efflux system outer membrane protein